MAHLFFHARLTSFGQYSAYPVVRCVQRTTPPDIIQDQRLPALKITMLFFRIVYSVHKLFLMVPKLQKTADFSATRSLTTILIMLSKAFPTLMGFSVNFFAPFFLRY